jgi:hypothetical protein
MSDVFTKRRPMIDLDEFERRLCVPCSADQKDGDLVAELLRIIGGKDDPHKTDFEPNTQLSAGARQDAGGLGERKQPDGQVRLAGGDFAAIEAGLLGTNQPPAAIPRDADRSTVEYERPSARAPLIGGDFAAIEAGLLGALREQATATVSETDIANAFPNVDLGSEHRLYQSNQPASHRVSIAERHIRSRHPLYVMVAIVIVGMAGIAVSFGLIGWLSAPPEIASIKSDSGPNTQRTEATSSANVLAQDAPNLSKPPEPSPMTVINGTERSFDLPRVEEKTLPAGSHAQLDNGAPAQTPVPAEPLSASASVESDTVKTDVVRSDGTLPSNGALPQTNINGALPTVPQSPAAAKAPGAKAAGHVAKPLKPAMAKHPGGHGHPRQIADKARATPMGPLTTEPAPSTNPQAVTPTAQPSPVTNGAFGFVQSAVNSLTSTTAKLFTWGTN